MVEVAVGGATALGGRLKTLQRQGLGLRHDLATRRAKQRGPAPEDCGDAASCQGDSEGRQKAGRAEVGLGVQLPQLERRDSHIAM
eukprot:6468771-Amphidinium_carterae.1